MMDTADGIRNNQQLPPNEIEEPREEVEDPYNELEQIIDKQLIYENIKEIESKLDVLMMNTNVVKNEETRYRIKRLLIITKVLLSNISTFDINKVKLYSNKLVVEYNDIREGLVQNHEEVV